MKKIYLVLLLIFSCNVGYCQRIYEGFIGIGPAIPIGDLTEYVHGGVGLHGGLETKLKDNIQIGAEASFHNLTANNDYSSFLSFSGFTNGYFNINYQINQVSVKPYVGIGLGIYANSYYNYYWDDYTSNASLFLSPRAGIRLDSEKMYVSGEGRLHLSTDPANSYMPFNITIGFKFGL